MMVFFKKVLGTAGGAMLVTSNSREIVFINEVA
jgi:hypothetical protein